MIDLVQCDLYAMGAVFQLLLAVSAAVVGYNLFSFMQKPTAKLEIDSDGWFGSGNKRADNEKIAPFKVRVTDEALKDLNERLDKARITHSVLENSPNFEYGFNVNYLKDVVKYWKNSFSWRKQESIINSFPQFTTEIEGLKIHFIHAKPPTGYRKVVPLLIVHGWPGNVFEFYKIIPMLTDPSQNLKLDKDIAFEVIAPSIPGYGWSDVPKKTGFNQWATARIFQKLMLRLGFKKFALQGGDWGSAVTTNIAHYYPKNVIGLHLNTIFMMPHANIRSALISLIGSIAPSLVFSSPTSFSFSLKNNVMNIVSEGGYLHLQATKPDTVGVGLNDSPVGLAAYILEKFSTWTNRQNRMLPDGGLTKKFTMDELLTIVTIYWLNGNIVNSQRYYKEYFLSPQRDIVASAYLSVPTGYASFPHDLIDRLPKELAETMFNITRYTEMPVGGHFAAFEEPELLAKDVVFFIKTLL